jgi:zinc transport system substrate-binding protein
MRLLGKWTVIAALVLIFAPLARAGEQVPVFVSIVPQKYFVEQIGGELVDVGVMVRPGASPATYEPRPKQMVDLSKARVYFAVGVPFENVWLKKITAANSKMKVVHTDRGIEKLPMAAHHEADGDADDDHHHEDGGLDPHIWLSPPLVKFQIRAILTALQEIDPSHAADYEANHDQFVSKIDALDSELKTMFADQQGLRFMVFHPSWGYFAHGYGLEQIPIEIEGKNPKPAQLKELIEHARENNIKVVFAQPQFSAKSARLVAGEIGGQVVFADPLAEDWLANLREVADKFKAALK